MQHITVSKPTAPKARKASATLPLASTFLRLRTSEMPKYLVNYSFHDKRSFVDVWRCE
jgi:hypothetical protein